MKSKALGFGIISGYPKNDKKETLDKTPKEEIANRETFLLLMLIKIVLYSSINSTYILLKIIFTI